MNVNINGQIFSGELMSTPEQLSQGMMNRDSLDGCMIFKTGKGHHSFWMKNCVIPLDIVFVSNNRISKIHNDCQPAGNTLNPPRYTGIGDTVIEFPSGTAKNWKVGDSVKLYLGTPENPVNKK